MLVLMVDTGPAKHDAKYSMRQFLAIGSGVPHYGTLPAGVVKQYDSLLKFLTTKWSTADTSGRQWLWQLNGCLDKLSAALLQVSRMQEHHGTLAAQAKDMLALLEERPGSSAAFSAREAACDFESLLLQARAALDRLTGFVAAAFGQTCYRFSKLENVLKKVVQDPRARDLLGFLEDAAWVKGVLLDFGGKKSLRSFVAHVGGISEAMDNCFSIQGVEKRGILLFDCESRRMPMLRTSREISRHLPFIVLNSLALFASIGTMKLDQYDPPWRNVSVVLSDYLEDAPDNPTLTVVERMTPDGFDLKTVRVKRTLFEEPVTSGRL